MSEDTKELVSYKKEKVPIENKESVRSLYGNDSIPIFEDVGRPLGVTITVLAKEGETYSNPYTNPITRKPEIFKGPVPEGKSYISIRHAENNDLNDFWKAVEARRSSLQNPSNPPKT